MASGDEPVDRWAGKRAIAALRFAGWEQQLVGEMAAVLHEARDDVLEVVAGTAPALAASAVPYTDAVAGLAERLEAAARSAGERIYRAALALIDRLFPVELPAYDLTGRLERLGYFVAELGADTVAEVGRTLTEGANVGEAVPDLTKRVRAEFDASDARARLIARTEVVGASNELSYDRATEANRLGIALWKTWLATADARTRPDHAAADGQTVALDNDFTVGGVAMAHPHDTTAPAGQVCNCRCTLIYQDEPPA